MMNPLIKERWCAALESGDYEQGSYFLVKDNTYFCCLGVLCDILDIPRTDVIGTVHGHFAGESEALPRLAMDMAGLTEANPHITTDDGVTTLAELNDSGLYTFADIAAEIRKSFTI